MQTLRSFV